MSEAGSIAQNPLPPAPRKSGSVGVSAGPDIAIVDDGGAFVGPDVAGEIVVRGPGTMSGYEDDPDANRRAFHEGWFRTGDSGHLDAEGYLFITGRIKEIINRGGMKVAPAEIDEALMRHPAVADAVAFGVPHPTLGEDVAAAVVVRESATVSVQELREFAFVHLAPHKVPSTISASGASHVRQRASSTAASLRMTSTPRCAPAMWRRATRARRSLPGSSRRCSISSASASTTTSSRLAEIRFAARG